MQRNNLVLNMLSKIENKLQMENFHEKSHIRKFPRKLNFFR